MTNTLAKECGRLEATNRELLEALKVLLRNHELGEYESQKQGLPRMIEARDMARKAIAKAESKEYEAQQKNLNNTIIAAERAFNPEFEG